jgi:myosin heavy subunit
MLVLLKLPELYDVCEIIHGEFGQLQSGLTSRSVELKNGDYFVTDLSASEAASSRDVLCRTIYSRLFTWLVGRINQSIKVRITLRFHLVTYHRAHTMKKNIDAWL